MDMQQTSQYDEQGNDGINIYCLIGMICSFVGLLLPPLLVAGLILSVVGLRHNKKCGKNLSGKVLGKIGVITSSVVLALYAIALIFSLTFIAKTQSQINDARSSRYYNQTDALSNSSNDNESLYIPGSEPDEGEWYPGKYSPISD